MRASSSGAPSAPCCNFDYPHDRYEIIVINDNSTDDTANVLKQIRRLNPAAT